MPGAYDLPLPGGAAARGDVYRITVEFRDVLDLVPQSSVKVDQVTVGAVEEIELNGWTARDPAAAQGRAAPRQRHELKQTSLLGEKYVELAPPSGAKSAGELGEGDNIPLDRTSRNPEVEEVLSAMSLLLNGGGVAQLKVIETELNNALRGNEAEIKDLIGQLDTFVGGLEEQKEIVRAIDGIDRLSARLAAQKEDIAAALETIPRGAEVLADQRKQFVEMLQALNRLGAVGTEVIQQSKADTKANLEARCRSWPSSGRATTSRVDAAAADLPLLRRHPRRDEGRLHQPARHRGPQPAQPRRQPRRAHDPARRRHPDPPDRPQPADRPGQSPPRRPAARPDAQPSSTSPGGGICLPGVTCQGSARSQGSSDGSWRSLYTGEANMIRRSVKVQLVAFLLITLVTVSSSPRATSGCTTGSPGASTSCRRTSPSPAGSSSAPSVLPGRAGRSRGALRLRDDGVIVDARIRRGVQIPEDTVAVENRSAVGEQYLDFSRAPRAGRCSRTVT